MNFYQVLNVGEQASQEEIRNAYLYLVRENHPDRHVGERTEEVRERFKKVQEAYEVLYDPVQRQAYDAKRIPQPRTTRQANSGKSPSAARTRVRPINPARRRDVPDDWLRRGGRAKRRRPILVTIFIVGIVSLATMVVPRCSDYVQQRFEVIEIPQVKPLPGPEDSSDPVMVGAFASVGIQEDGDSEVVLDPDSRVAELQGQEESMGDGLADRFGQLDEALLDDALPEDAVDELSRFLDGEPQQYGELFLTFEGIALPELTELPTIDLSALPSDAELAAVLPVESSSMTWFDGADMSFPSVFEGRDFSATANTDLFSEWSGGNTAFATTGGATTPVTSNVQAYGTQSIETHPGFQTYNETQALHTQPPDIFSVGPLSGNEHVQVLVPPIQRPLPPGASPTPMVSMAIDQNEQQPTTNIPAANSGFGSGLMKESWNAPSFQNNFQPGVNSKLNRFQREQATSPVTW